MFNNGLKYVIPYQSRFNRKSSVDEILKKQYEHVLDTVKSCLKDNKVCIADARAKQAFSALEDLFIEFAKEKIPKRIIYRAQYEHRIVRSIQRLLQQRPDIVIRRTDKSKVFYIGRASDFTRKSEEYMLKTSAYEQITSGRCPLADNLSAVQTLLQFLFNKKVLTKAQFNWLSPKMDKLELGHYHGLPKPHKVN